MGSAVFLFPIIRCLIALILWVVIKYSVQLILFRNCAHHKKKDSQAGVSIFAMHMKNESYALPEELMMLVTEYYPDSKKVCC